MRGYGRITAGVYHVHIAAAECINIVLICRVIDPFDVPIYFVAIIAILFRFIFSFIIMLFLPIVCSQFFLHIK